MPSGGQNKVDLTGEVFGSLTVVKQNGSNNRGLALWECLCKCGNTITTPGYYLRTRNKKSCGCLSHRNKGDKNPRWSGHGEISGSYWNGVKSNAKARDLVFDITIEYAWELFLKQNGKCALTGVVLETYASDQDRRNSKGQSASLDRIDSTKGYTEDNVQWVHKDVNRIKMNMKEFDFIELCKRVVEYNELKIING